MRSVAQAARSGADITIAESPALGALGRACENPGGPLVPFKLKWNPFWAPLVYDWR